MESFAAEGIKKLEELLPSAGRAAELTQSAIDMLRLRKAGSFVNPDDLDQLWENVSIAYEVAAQNESNKWPATKDELSAYWYVLEYTGDLACAMNEESKQMTDHAVAIKVADFNETEFKQFGHRTGDRWTFSIPYCEMQSLDELLPNHVLGIETKLLQPHGEIIMGKLIPKK